ncbi:hypothetical protein [Alienimonas californiensis]|uniref:D-glucuronyl C5-epimerase C-terminal domain-containing protein n=1 Tax=Alienimonas californiensis TaxID=2527989 RepID=A0A517PDH4_9PLAN|nr:hypothetical protein [Alienimonas californiensis]QDT17429.1 hypothetical protein CA12_35520 [Alienimonas californiensis]
MTGSLSCLLLAALPAQLPDAAPSSFTPPSLSAEATRSAMNGPLPPTDDLTADALAEYETALTAHYGGTREVPLAVKAAFYDWVIRRHHLEQFAPTPDGAPVGIVHQTAFLPAKPGERGEFNAGPDTLTWNGALLAAMSYRWAISRDPAALEWVRTLLGGLELGMKVTGQPGLPARCYTQAARSNGELSLRYEQENGRTIWARSDAAKGTVNQIAGGLIVCQLLCGDDLGPKDRNRAAQMSLDMADHLVRHDYHLTERTGKRTEYGDLTPRIGPQSIPFNAQVAYLVVAGGAGLGVHAENADPAAVNRVMKAFEELRVKHHVYYEAPTQVVRPQRIGASLLLKGMNDRHHSMTAGYTALLLEWELARRANAAADGRFLYEMGRTPLYAMRGVRGERNSLLAFLWGGLLMDGRRAAAILPDPQEQIAEFDAARREIEAGVEHLHRFPLSRRSVVGEMKSSREDVWIAEQRPWDCYVWKADPNEVFVPTGPPMNKWAAGIDFLHAYWVARYWSLPGVQ